MLVCKKCGGKNISCLQWVDANTNEYVNEYDCTKEEQWCEDCQDHVKFVNNEFEIKQ